MLLVSYSMSIHASDIDDIVAKNKPLFANQELLDPVFERIYQLEQNRAWKINIVHIGDSHIQADFLTNVIRKSLQKEYGNGGYGFTFPYSLMRTNGTDLVKYTSNALWKSRLNVSPVTAGVTIGLSGIGLYTNSTNFMVQLNASNECTFNSVKVIYPTEKAQYRMSLSDAPITTIVEEKVQIGKKVEHEIRRGESLSILAARYKTTVQVIKDANKLTSDLIHAGWVIMIPIPVEGQAPVTRVVREKVNYIDIHSYPYYSTYTSKEPLNRVNIYSQGNASMYDINGFVLENDTPGVVYHGIGVNGAKMSDFSKYPLFFKQLPVLNPDLIVLSFGTNESYQKLSAEQYITRLNKIVENIKSQNPNTVVLVMTPPPSLLRRRATNVLVGEYSEALMEIKTLPIWDLYNQMDGVQGISAKGKYASVIARDKIHYTQKGYKIQGEKFSEDFITAYKQFKIRKGY